MQFDRRRFIQAAGIAILGVVPGGCGVSAIENKAKRPNFILIMADDLGYGDLGCYGNQSFKTPNIDKLAAGGMKFTDYHSNGAVCSPTRAALMTGRYQQRCGISGVVTAANHRHTGMSLEETTFAEVLKSAGYATALFGKWHLGYQVEFNPSKQGFDHFTGFVSGNVDYQSHIDQQGYEDWWQGTELKPQEGYSTYLIGRHGLGFIERHRKEPFCLYLAHESPHYPYQGPDDPGHRQVGNAKPVQGIRKDKQVAYREMIEAMDKTIGQIMDKLKGLGLEENTFIFFCSDNGANRVGSNGKLKGYKGSLWEGGHRVPAIAYWPGKIAAGVTTDETSISMDLFATMTELGKVRLPAGSALDGVSLVPVLLKGQALPQRTLFWQHKNQKAVRKAWWKLVIDKDKIYLFDLEKDPGESANVAEQYPAVVKELTDELDAWQQDVSLGVEKRT